MGLRTDRELHFNAVSRFLTELFERKDKCVEILVGSMGAVVRRFGIGGLRL